jgi:uncharacterized protein YecA (UPF0149 family)
MSLKAHRWMLGEAWSLPAEAAPAVASGTEPGAIDDTELLTRAVTCIDCHVEFSRAGGRPCRTRAVPIARNHPCPCGSGRRYRSCCARGQ